MREEPDDYAFECSFCGKPMQYRYCGMCVQCEQVDNDVPDFDLAPTDEPFKDWEGHCPVCGGYIRTIGGNYDTEPMQDVCEDCDWKGKIEY